MARPGFDEWAAARVPSLLRFAYLVTGSREAAEDAVQTALAQALRAGTGSAVPTIPTATYAG